MSYKFGISGCLSSYTNLQSFHRHAKKKHEWLFKQYMLYFNKTHKPCEDINPTVLDVNNAEKRGILGQDLVLNEIDIDGSDYARDEENVFASGDYDSLIGEFLLGLREKLNVTTAATCFVAEKLNYF